MKFTSTTLLLLASSLLAVAAPTSSSSSSDAPSTLSRRGEWVVRCKPLDFRQAYSLLEQAHTEDASVTVPPKGSGIIQPPNECMAHPDKMCGVVSYTKKTTSPPFTKTAKGTLGVYNPEAYFSTKNLMMAMCKGFDCQCEEH